jgi:hypothetical protein
VSLVQFTSQCVTTCPRHVDIGDHHVWPKQSANTKCLIPPKRDLNLMPLIAHYEREHVRGVAVIIGDKDA